MFNLPGNLGDLMKNMGRAQEAVEKAREALGRVEVEGSAGGGAVTARVNGRLEVVAVRIEPKLLADGDAELLEDMIVAAVNQGLSKAKEASARESAKSLQELTGLAIPPGLGNLFGAGGGA